MKNKWILSSESCETTSKDVLYCDKLAITQRKWFFVDEMFNHESQSERLSCMKKEVHLMETWNAPTITSFRYKLKGKVYPFKNNEHLKMKTYTRSFEEMGYKSTCYHSYSFLLKSLYVLLKFSKAQKHFEHLERKDQVLRFHIRL